MKAVAILLLFSLASVAADEALDPPKVNQADQILAAVTEKLDRSHLIQLAAALPALFRVHFLCQYQGAAVIPGEWIDSPEGGSLRCPGNYEITLGRQTRIRLTQMGSSPAVYLERGSVSAAFGRSALFLETKTFTLNSTGLGRTQRLAVSLEGKSPTVSCLQGSLSADFETPPDDDGLQILTAQACRMEIALNAGALKRYLLSDDKVQAANLVLPRRFWPTIGQLPSSTPGTSAPGEIPGIALSVTPGQDPTQPFRAQWMIPSLLQTGSDCSIFAQRGDSERAQKVTTFQSQAGSGDLLLDPAYRGFSLSMVCEDEKNTIASNLILQSPPGI